MDKIRILYVLASLDICNGMVSYSMNYFRKINKEKFQVDFIISSNKESPYYDEIRSSGSNIYVMPELKLNNAYKLSNELNNFFKNNKYHIIHCHLANVGALYLKYAKKHNIGVRILHSHATKSADKIIKKIRNNILIPFSKFYANYYFACSEDAGKYMFGKDKFNIVKNAIDLDKFIFNEQKRKEKRLELGITEKFVVGNVGRLSPQKNPLFMLDIFYEIQRMKDNAILLLIGDGPMEVEVNNKIIDMGLEKKVILLSDRTDIAEIYNAMDVFVLPSIYEGLGIVYIEGQASGLKCFGSDKVPIEARISSLMNFIELKENHKVWAKKIVNVDKENNRIDNLSEVMSSGYNINNEIKKLEELYLSLLKE